MMKSKIVLSMVLATALTSCAVSGSQGVKQAKTVKGGFMGLITQDDIHVESAGAFKEAKDVVIASFKVGFVNDKSARASSSRVRAKANIKLNGIDDAVKQEATEKAYNDFVSKLKANGYNVVSKDALFADNDFKTTKSYAAPYDDDGTKYFTPKSFGELKFFAGDSPAFMGGFATSNPITAAVEFAEKNKVKILSVTYTIDFANAANDGWSSISAVDVGQGITVAPGSKVVLIGGQGSAFNSAIGNVSLGQPVSSNIEYGKLKNTNTDGYVAAETAVNIAGALLGGGALMGQTRDYEIDANPAKYKEAVAQVLDGANKAITTKMSSLR